MLGEPTLRESRDRHDADLLRERIDRYSGNRSEAARSLGITREGLYKLAARVGVDLAARWPRTKWIPAPTPESVCSACAARGEHRNHAEDLDSLGWATGFEPVSGDRIHSGK